MFYSRASEALFLFIRLSLAGSVAFETYPSKPTVGGIIKKCGKINGLPYSFSFENSASSIGKIPFVRTEHFNRHSEQQP